MAKDYVFWSRGDHMLGETAGAFAIDKALALFTPARKSKPVKRVRVLVVRWIDVSQRRNPSIHRGKSPASWCVGPLGMLMSAPYGIVVPSENSKPSFAITLRVIPTKTSG
jgi:hypothetical protein